MQDKIINELAVKIANLEIENATLKAMWTELKEKNETKAGDE